MVKKILYTAVLAALIGYTYLRGQSASYTAGTVFTYGSSLPGTCSVGAVFVLNSGTIGLNVCTATNTWTAVTQTNSTTVPVHDHSDNNKGGSVSSAGGGSLTQLSQITTASSQSTVDFTSISGSYTNLRIDFITRDTAAGTGVSALRVKINNDGTAANYTVTERIGVENGGTLFTEVASSTKGVWIGIQPNDGNTSGRYSTGSIEIPYYATALTKNVWGRNVNHSSAVFDDIDSSAEWSSTAVITRVTIGTDGTAFKDGSIYTLYGIK